LGGSVSVDIGTSTLYSTEWVVERTVACAPKSILDVGCGWGRWGFLAREFLEVWVRRFRPEDWAVTIHGVDIHEGTWTPLHEYLYDQTFTADIRTWDPPQQYDLAICCDVVEHMTKPEAVAMLEKLMSVSAHVLVGVPLDFGLRPGFDSNPYEAHVAVWGEHDLDALFAPEHRAVVKIEEGHRYGLYQLRGNR